MKSDEEKVDKDVTGEVEGMVKKLHKSLGIPVRARCRDELMDATHLDMIRKFMKQSRWMSVVDEKTAETVEEIEETWIEVNRRTTTQEPRQPEEDGKNRQMIQIFFKVEGSKMFTLMVSPSNKVDDVLRRILNNVKSSKSDVYGRVKDECFDGVMSRGFPELVMDTQCRS